MLPLMVEIDPEDRVWHRHYVGALWEEIGRLQIDFLRAEGLRRGHTLVDIACGSLRGGVHLIPYLRRGRYLGIDKSADLIAAGLHHELPSIARWRKAPEFVVSDGFEFERFSRRADYGIAQSLFTHLTPLLVELCLRNLRAWSPGCWLYATFFEGGSDGNPPEPHDNLRFRYTRSEMVDMAERAGWSMRYIGEWGHPRGQVVAALTAR
jgi:hypothetical protein